MMSRNKRRADRVPCDLVLELRDRTEYVATGTGRLINLSTSGACFASRAVLSLGELIQGRVRSSIQEIVRFSAQVVWTRPTNGVIYYGIHFR